MNSSRNRACISNGGNDLGVADTVRAMTSAEVRTFIEDVRRDGLVQLLEEAAGAVTALDKQMAGSAVHSPNAKRSHTRKEVSGRTRR